MSTDFLQSDSMPGLWIDALVRDDEDNVLFLSAWGSETAIQKTRARFSLPVSENGLRGFKIHTGPGRWRFDRFAVTQPERYEQETARPTGSRFLHLTQLWMFPRLAIQPNNVDHKALLLKRPTESPEQWQSRLWQAVQTVCPVPLHPSWDGVVADFIRHNWIRQYQGFHIDAWCLHCPEKEVQPWVTTAVQQGRLALPTTH